MSLTRVRRPTDRQIRALHFTCSVLELDFPGNINNEYDVSMWLKWYFVKAKEVERKAREKTDDCDLDLIADYADAVGIEV